jgi:hypothetical protein
MKSSNAFPPASSNGYCSLMYYKGVNENVTDAKTPDLLLLFPGTQHFCRESCNTFANSISNGTETYAKPETLTEVGFYPSQERQNFFVDKKSAYLCWSRLRQIARSSASAVASDSSA